MLWMLATNERRMWRCWNCGHHLDTGDNLGCIDTRGHLITRIDNRTEQFRRECKVNHLGRFVARGEFPGLHDAELGLRPQHGYDLHGEPVY